MLATIFICPRLFLDNMLTILTAPLPKNISWYLPMPLFGNYMKQLGLHHLPCLIKKCAFRMLVQHGRKVKRKTLW